MNKEKPLKLRELLYLDGSNRAYWGDSDWFYSAPRERDAFSDWISPSVRADVLSFRLVKRDR